MKRVILYLEVFFVALLTFFGSSFAFDVDFINVGSPVASLIFGLGLCGFSLLRRKRPFRK